MKVRCPDLVEVLFVILEAAILFAIAIPLYNSSNNGKKFRQCAANVTAIATAENSGNFTTNLSALKYRGGLTSIPKCPLGDKAYELSLDKYGDLHIACPYAERHRETVAADASVINDKLKLTLKAKPPREPGDPIFPHLPPAI